MLLPMIFAFSLISTSVKEGILKAFKNEAATKYEKVFVKLHTGDPGSEGKNNAAGETKRKQITFTGSSPLKNSAALKWENVSTAETVEYISFWTEESGGTFLGSTPVEAKKTVAVGDNLEIPVESLSWSVA